MGRHNRPSHTTRNSLIVGVTAVAGLSSLFAAPASADVYGSQCTDGARNPDVRVCQDSPVTDGSDAIHALVKLNPVACVHAVIDPQGHRRLVETRDCDRTPTTLVIVPQQPAPGSAAPCPVGATSPSGTPCPCPPGATPGTQGSAPTGTAPAETAPASNTPVYEAPAPTIVNNQTSPAPLPAVTG